MKFNYLFILILLVLLTGCSSQNKASNQQSSEEGLTQPDLEQPNSEEIWSGNTYKCTEFTVRNGRIYYLNSYDDGSLYSVNTDGSDNYKLTDSWTSKFHVSDDSVYYTNYRDEDKLYRMNLDGSGKCKISDDSFSSIFWNVTDRQILFNT